MATAIQQKINGQKKSEWRQERQRNVYLKGRHGDGLVVYKVVTGLMSLPGTMVD